jgi:PAS domain S-box-containing protein
MKNTSSKKNPITGRKKQAKPVVKSALNMNTQRMGSKKSTASTFNNSELYVSVLDNMLEGCQIIGFDWRYLYLNHSAEMHNRRPNKELLGRKYMDMWPGIEATQVFNVIKRCLEERTAHQMENEFIFPDGKQGWFNLSIQPIPDGVFILSIDITERKQAEEDLRKSEERFRSLYENASIGMYRTSPSGEILLANPALVKMLGYSSFEALAEGRNLEQEGYELGYERNEFRQQMQRSGEVHGLESAWTRMDGTILNVRESARTVKGPDGQTLYYEGTVEDITERKRAEEALQKAHDELELQVLKRTADLSQSNMLIQTLLDNMPDQIYFKDAGSRFIKNSKAQTLALGLSDPSQVVGKTDFDFFPHAQRSYDDEQEIIRSGNPLVDFEERVVWPDGHETWVSTTKVPLRNTENKIIGTMGISRDITDRKRNEEALQKARDELEAFSYSVSHDLRAPLRGIDGWSLALLEDYGTQLDEQGQEYIKRVRSEAQHMGELIDDMLQLSRITRAEMHTERVDLSALARSIVARLQESERDRKVEFIVQNDVSATGDAHLLDVVLTNLLGNAFKFTGKVSDARIEFGMMDINNERVFFVRDNGAGFDMAYAKKLFGVFQRMHKASEFPGTGIGLATVQRIINRHGGRVWAESAVDRGATFFFTLEEGL